jgi:hypothetical protein
MRLELKKFDIASIKDDKVVVLIGKRDTGKSFLIRDLLFHHRNIPVGTVISATESANAFFGHIVPGLFIHDEYEPAIVENVVARQKKVMKAIAAGSTAVVDPRSFLIIDDCLFDKRWINDRNIRFLFMNGRHVRVFFVIAMQFALGIPPVLRTNIDYVFILRENIVSNRKRIYDHYAGMFPSFEVFCSVMDQCTENYECLVINNNAKSNRLEDQVFWYRAEERPPFRIGAPQLWAMHNEMYNNGADDDEEAFDSQSLRRRKGPPISVRRVQHSS